MIFTQSEGLPTEPLRPNAKVFYYAREVVKSKSQRELKDHDFMKEFYELHFDVDHLLLPLDGIELLKMKKLLVIHVSVANYG